VREEDPTKTELDHGSGKATPKKVKEKFGTVGAVALDVSGNVAAATSTGGMTNKKWGRVGDSPLIGAGTYANHLCAISCTGWGEYFIRLCVAKSVADLMEYKEYSLKKACNEIILNKLPKLGGDGGLVAVDKDGNVAMPFSTEGMYRGYVKTSGRIVVEIYREP
jgi:beta-aspartyl-peptidase (threonine type)